MGTEPIQDAVILGNLPGGIWPILEAYKNDAVFSNLLSPYFIWDSITASPGETRYFAVAYEPTTMNEHLIFILTFSDDAHRLFVEERTPSGEFVKALTPDGGLMDSPMNPDSGPVIRPFNWQRIRYWSIDDFTPENEDNLLVISYEVVNYNPIDSVNPAGLAFVIDIYDALEVT